MTFDFAAARNNMVDSQVRTADVTDPAIQDAMRRVERERLCPADRLALAYADAEVPLGDGRWLMRPRDVAKLLQALRPRAGERALAVAAPYAAAVMQDMGLEVARWDDPSGSRPPEGEFDVIVCEGAVSAVPESWIQLLASGGRLGAVERKGPVGKARLYVESERGLGAREAFDATPPILPGFGTTAQFAF